MLVTISLVAMLAIGEVPPEALSASASIDGKRLRRNAEYEITLEIETAPGWSATDSGVPNPLLQIDVPESARLSGRVIDSFQALSRNDFLMEPYERLVDKPVIVIPFKPTRHITKAGDGDESFGLNILAYLKSPDGETHFVRRRLELPLAPKAVAESGDANKSNWGVEDTLDIGEKADDFTLPRADGSTVSLSDYIGKKNVIVTTYRAHW